MKTFTYGLFYLAGFIVALVLLVYVIAVSVNYIFY